jgi:transcriptional regulator of acetoin/glycerol metabolism
LVNTLGGTSVLIGGIPAPLYYGSPGQINAQAPFELIPGNLCQIQVNSNGALSTPGTIQVATATPGVAALPTGQVIAQHADYSLVTFFVDEAWLTRATPKVAAASALLPTDLAEGEKALIENALREAEGLVSGPAGAAAKLGIPRQTLESKIRKLGINRLLFKTS